MASAFGIALRRLREKRVPALSLRQFAQVCALDHAYVHRLESGEKDAPSDDTLASLFRVLKPTHREERILRFLVGRDVDQHLLDMSILDDESIVVEDFESAAQMSFRGGRPQGPDDWRKTIAKIKQLREEFENG